jgi:hypothetical protein
LGAREPDHSDQAASQPAQAHHGRQRKRDADALREMDRCDLSCATLLVMAERRRSANDE